jgi:uncharacterized membrane protein YqjE
VIDPAVDQAITSWSKLAGGARRVLQRLLAIGGNRLELFEVELHEARDGFLRAICLVLGVAAFGFLAVIALTAAVVVSLWQTSPVVVLLVVTVIYGGVALCLYSRLRTHHRKWKAFPESLDQLRKDRDSLEKMLS